MPTKTLTGVVWSKGDPKRTTVIIRTDEGPYAWFEMKGGTKGRPKRGDRIEIEPNRDRSAGTARNLSRDDEVYELLELRAGIPPETEPPDLIAML